MSPLDATFTLTPGNPWYSANYSDYAYIFCYGADFYYSPPKDLVSLYAGDRLFFRWQFRRRCGPRLHAMG
jgi:hypothetical protein